MQFKGHAWTDVATITLGLEVNNGAPILLAPVEEGSPRSGGGCGGGCGG